MTLEEFAAKLDEAAVICKKELELDLVKLGEITSHDAQAAIGTYRYGWPQLAESTQTERVDQGYSPNEPLLRTGEMRATIRAEVGPLIIGSVSQFTDLVLAVGSPDLIALWQEMGTTKGIPPRPFLSSAMLENLPTAVNLMSKTALKLLTGR